MYSTTLRLGLSLMVVISFWSGRLAAQDVLVAPTVPYEPAHHPPSPPPFTPNPRPLPAKYLHTRVMNHFNLCCQADRWGSVGNFHSEMIWLFGSSRSFFGEYCVPNQPCADRRAQQQQVR